MLAVVKSATRGTITEPIVLDIKCNLYPNIQPFVWLNPHIASVSIPERGTIPFFIEDLCHTYPLALIRVLSAERIDGSTIFSRTKSSPIAAILFLISSDIVVRRLSNVLLLGILDSPHPFITFLLYDRSIARYSCNDLLESNLNQIRTTKHLRITVGEYTYGLPRFFFLLSCFDHDIKPIKYKILIRIDVDLLCASLLARMIVFHQNIILHRLALFVM